MFVEKRELDLAELDYQDVTELPDRHALSLVNANVAAPINAALALNVLSDNSVAYANAQQTAPVVKGSEKWLVGGVAGCCHRPLRP